MSDLIASSQTTALIGLGVTGFSVARYLTRENRLFRVFDTRTNPPQLAQFEQEFPRVAVALGELDEDALAGFAQIVLSPGISRKLPAIARAIANGTEVIGDIELFARKARAPIVGITGSNGKTTVTTLLGEMAKNAGVKVKVGGNLGTPALDLLADDCELYVLELSSFQLESTLKLNAQVACILNMSADHLDRYANMQEYWVAKQRIFLGAKKIVVNRDDALTQCPIAKDRNYVSFGAGAPDLNQYGLRNDGDGDYIARGFTPLLYVREMLLAGRHNALNAQAALALGEFAGLPQVSMVATLKEFRGLPHRCQFVAQVEGVTYHNDSKGTNLGATVAAIEGIASHKNIVLIAGGDAKGGDFSELRPVARKHLRGLVQIGVDGPKIAAACADECDVVRAESMQAAVAEAKRLAKPGDAVLLSPACASFDMFKNYEDRGAQFIACVEALCS